MSPRILADIELPNEFIATIEMRFGAPLCNTTSCIASFTVTFKTTEGYNNVLEAKLQHILHELPDPPT